MGDQITMTLKITNELYKYISKLNVHTSNRTNVSKPINNLIIN